MLYTWGLTAWRVYSGCFGIGGVDGGGTIAVELLAQFYLVVRSQGLAIKLDVGQGPLERFQNGPGWAET